MPETALGSGAVAVLDGRVRVLVIGAGIAGTFLARELHERGVSVQVVDDPSIASASRAAAGLVNPVIGIRLTLVPGVEDLLAQSFALFSTLEQSLGRTLWHPLPIDRFFRDAGERARWEKRAGDPAYAPWVVPLPGEGDRAPWGGIRIQRGGWFDYRCLPDILDQAGIPRIADRIDASSLEAAGNGVVWRGDFYDAAVWCQGSGADDPWFTGLPWKAALGEIMTLRSAVGPRDAIWMRGIFVVPLGEGLFRVGSTYRWTALEGGPSPEGREEILGRWRVLGLPEPEVVDHRSGVRPILQDRQPVAGPHPQEKAVWIVNGLGSRGAMTAPTLVRQVADAMLGGAPVPAAWNVARFFRRA